LKPPIAMIGSSLASWNGAALGADVYIPLARAQALASMPSEVNTIYVLGGSPLGEAPPARTQQHRRRNLAG
jgi:hypothetical protein